MIEDVLEILKQEEGWSERLYPDPGGVGRCIGYGRNLDLDPLDKEEGEYLLVKGVEKRLDAIMILTARRISPDFWKSLPDTAKVVLLCMTFQIGVRGTLKFKKMLAAMAEADWMEASQELLDSKFGRDSVTRDRCWRLSQYLAEIPYEED